jgi:hypothetical protein
MSRSLPRVERSNITEPHADDRSSAIRDPHPEGSFVMHKKESLTPSIPRRLDGLAMLLLAIGMLMLLGMSLRTLYQFPVIDGFRWYGDETWMMLSWKQMISHGRLTVPVALGSELLKSPGLLLGSPWLAALVYGVPQLVASTSTDLVNIGRVVSFVLGVSTLLFLGWFAYRIKIRASVTILSMALLTTSRSFTFATHSARYDIITGFVLLLFVGIMAMLIPSTSDNKERRGNNTKLCFLIGLSGAFLTFAISPHLEALLPAIVLYAAWYHRAFRTWKATWAFFSGALLALVAIVGLYIIPNHSFSIAGGISADNQFGSVMNNLPFHHLFSWSAQRPQLWAKGFYLMNEAPLFAIVLPLVFISEAALLITRRPHRTTAFVTVCLLFALAVALFVQSTLPYYLIHVLPLATLTFAMHLQAWSKPVWSAPIITVASLALSAMIWLQTIPELAHAGRVGKMIGEANTAAIQAAIELSSRDWEPGGPKPLILAQGPAIHELLRDTAIRVMNESFLFFPIRRKDRSTEIPDTVISRAGVDYVLDYNKPMTPAYEAAIRHGEPIFSRVGPLLDRTVDYFHDSTSEIDTLTLYELDTTK